MARARRGAAGRGPADARRAHRRARCCGRWCATGCATGVAAGAGGRRRSPPRSRAAAPGSRLNLLLTDGETVAAIDLGARLSVRERGRPRSWSPPSRSTPTPAWEPVPDRHLVVADRLLRHRPPPVLSREAPAMNQPVIDVPPHARPRISAALRQDVLSGLGTRAEVAAAEVVLRRPGQRAVRGDHPAARSTTRPAPSGRSCRPGPARSPGAPGPRRWSSWARAPRRRPGCCSTRCARTARWGRSCRSTCRSPRCARRSTRSPRTTPACACTAWSATSPSTSAGCRPLGPRLVAFLGGTIGNLLPERARRVPGRGADGAAAGRVAAARHRPGQGPRDAGRGVRRRGRRHRASSTSTCCAC